MSSIWITSESFCPMIEATEKSRIGPALWLAYSTMTARMRGNRGFSS